MAELDLPQARRKHHMETCPGLARSPRLPMVRFIRILFPAELGAAALRDSKDQLISGRHHRAFTAYSVFNSFRQGPGLIEVARPIMAFLRKWSLRPFSQWQSELIGQAWAPWQASLIVRAATFMWFLAGHCAMALIAIGFILLLGNLIGS